MHCLHDESTVRWRNCEDPFPSLSPSATTTAAMPPANPAAPAPWRRSPPTGSRPPAATGRRSPLRLFDEIDDVFVLPKIGGNRNRPGRLNQTNTDCADRCGGNRILTKDKKGAAGGSAHRLLRSWRSSAPTQARRAAARGCERSGRRQAGPESPVAERKPGVAWTVTPSSGKGC